MELVLDEPAENDTEKLIQGVRFAMQPRDAMFIEKYGCSVDAWNSPWRKSFMVSLRYSRSCC